MTGRWQQTHARGHLLPDAQSLAPDPGARLGRSPIALHAVAEHRGGAPPQCPPRLRSEAMCRRPAPPRRGAIERPRAQPWVANDLKGSEPCKGGLRWRALSGLGLRSAARPGAAPRAVIAGPSRARGVAPCASSRAEGENRDILRRGSPPWLPPRCSPGEPTGCSQHRPEGPLVAQPARANCFAPPPDAAPPARIAREPPTAVSRQRTQASTDANTPAARGGRATRPTCPDRAHNPCPTSRPGKKPCASTRKPGRPTRQRWSWWAPTGDQILPETTPLSTWAMSRSTASGC